MNYPLISEYIEAIKNAEENFEQLKSLRPVLGDDGEPVFSGGNFAVVFKMKDEQTGKLHAVKCFLREQEGRAVAYRQIAEELEFVNSTFLTPIKYLDKELFVDTNASDETEFPVLLMDWVEGETLDKYIRQHIDDQYELSLLAYQFSRLAMWLMPQPFAHGDLKPDNILVKNDGTLVLVDYDGMYVPAMKGQKARELGSPDFRHPNRTDADFDEHIDDFSLASILLSLKAISLQPDLLEEYGASDRLLLSEKDYRNLSESKVMDALKNLLEDMELIHILTLYYLCSAYKTLFKESYKLFQIQEPAIPLWTKDKKDTSLNIKLEKVERFDDIISYAYNGKKWGVIDSMGNTVVPFIYDEIKIRENASGMILIMCGYDGEFYKGYTGRSNHKEETIYTGKYDLYDSKGEFLLGGFCDYEFDLQTMTFLFLFGRKWMLYPKHSDHPWEVNRFSLGNPGKWIMLNMDFNIPFDYNLQYVDPITHYYFTSKDSFKGGRFLYEKNKLMGYFKRYTSPICFPADILFDKITNVNSTTILGINHPFCANEKRRVVHIGSHIKSDCYYWTETIDEQYTFVYRYGLGLLENGKEVLSCDYAFITKPVDGWTFVVKSYPYIPDKRVHGKYFVLLWDLKQYKYDFQIYKAIVAIEVIDKKDIEGLLYEGALKLYKVGEDETSLSSYTVQNKNIHRFNDSFVKMIHAPVNVYEPSHTYWQSSEGMKLKKEGPIKSHYEDDHYGLMDALDGNPDAYWNID